MSKLEVNKEEVVNIYNNSTPEQKEVLKKVFGEILDVRDSVKDFGDACYELGKDHVFFKEYVLCQENGCSNDLIAYLKLRIITAALNEGWEPKFDSMEQRYFPWFNAIRGKICVPCKVDSFTDSLSRTAFTSCGHFLAFKSKELAEYAGKQFMDIYSDLNGIWKLR